MIQETGVAGPFSRRDFLRATGAVPGAALTAAAMGAGPAAAASEPALRFAETIDTTLRVNGTDYRLPLEARVTLLDALRERIGLTGAKKGCNRGECGACTVHIDGRRANACMVLAVAVQGKAITTIEGLAQGDTLHPVQHAFIEEDAFQCGYCTPGQVMSAVACIQEGHAGSDAEIREWMSGNICRCSAYPQIVAAVKTAAARMKG
jgi:xanthine dehydrogenase YagT iron-sulfur-binding subunit